MHEHEKTGRDTDKKNAEKGRKRGHFSIYATIMEDHHYDKNELFQAAFEQAPGIDPPMLVSLENQMFGFQGDNYLETGRISEEDKVPMYVLSNESGMLGAYSVQICESADVFWVESAWGCHESREG